MGAVCVPQAYQKRVYAVRDFYLHALKGTTFDNPGWDDLVVNVLGSIAKLVGKKAQHVPQVEPPCILSFF